MLCYLNEYLCCTVFTKIHFVSGFPRNNNRKTGVYREIIPGESSGKQISWGNRFPCDTACPAGKLIVHGKDNHLCRHCCATREEVARERQSGSRERSTCFKGGILIIIFGIYTRCQ